MLRTRGSNAPADGLPVHYLVVAFVIGNVDVVMRRIVCNNQEPSPTAVH